VYPPRRHYGYRSDAVAGGGGPLTPAGAAWVAKALNPAHGLIGTVPIPDASAAVSAVGEIRIVENIGSGVIPGSYDMDVLFMPGPSVLGFWRVYAAGTVPAVIPWTPFQNPLTATGTGTPPAMLWRTIRTSYASITAYCNAAALTTQGRVIAGQFVAPGVLTANLSGYASVSSDIVAALAISDKARAATQLAAAFDSVGAVVNTVNMDQPPLTEEGLYMTGPGVYVGLAKDGIYMPLKFNQPVHDYCSLNESSGNMVFVSAAGLTLSPLPGRTVAGLNTQIGVLLFRGLDKTTTIQVKLKYGLEATCDGASSWAPFLESGAIMDVAAVTAVAAAQQGTPYAYPAQANDYNGVIRAIGGSLSGQVPRTVAGALLQAGLPVRVESGARRGLQRAARDN